MSTFEKDKDLLSGKGEWDETEHPRDNDGKFTSKGGESQSSADQPKYETKKDAMKHLVNTLKKIKKAKIKEIHSFIKSLNPVKLQINDNEIIAEFDKFTADKNVFTIGNSDIEGYNYKLSNIDKLPSHVEDSKYRYSKDETGKNTRQHKDVKKWHYFANEIDTELGKFNITVNVRDKGENKYIYEVTFKKKKT